MARLSISSAAGLEWMTSPFWLKATTPSVMWRKRVDSLVRSLSTSCRVAWSCRDMALKAWVSTPISSWDSARISWPKSPSATRWAPRVRARMGLTMARERRKERNTEITRPKTRASMISWKSSLLSSRTVERWSKM